MVFITETSPFKLFSERSDGICSKFWRKHPCTTLFSCKMTGNFNQKSPFSGIYVRFWEKLSNIALKIFMKMFIMMK